MVYDCDDQGICVPCTYCDTPDDQQPDSCITIQGTVPTSLAVLMGAQ